jgi:uncharacterized protein (DUF1499 family)
MVVASVSVALVVAGLCLMLRLYMGRTAEDVLQPGEQVVIGELRDPLPGNAFLACPPGFCAATGAASPEFAISRERLEAAFDDMLANEINIVPVAYEAERHCLVVIQHTPLLQFPDIVTIEFIALAADRSTLALYSRARYGRSDFGTNRRRVLRWLNRLKPLAG